jgi:DNA-binding NtrC family response regulator
MDAQAPAVLLIEKDYVTLELYQRELSKSFTVVACTEIGAALASLANREIRAVIIEPEIDSGRGWELIDTIWQAFPNRFLPVVVCTTRDTWRDWSPRMVARYLTKPVLPKTLREKTLEVIAMREPD